MAKISTSRVFKTDNQQQSSLLPPYLGDIIPANDMVRVVNELVDQMDISDLIDQYKGGGASAYSPRMMLKILLYGYSVKIYTGRKLAAAIRQNINFMWLCGTSKPDFRTINLFRSSKAKGVIESLFKEMLELLIEHQYITMEHYFCDGTTIRADANQHKVSWKKNATRYKEVAEEKCKTLFEQIDQLNANEDKQFGNHDLPETGAASTITREAIAAKARSLDETIKTATTKKAIKTATGLQKKLVKQGSKIAKYERQIDEAGKRSGASITDKDASAMRMKNKVEVLPAYNVMAGSEDQFITGVTVHQNSNDATCLIDHLEQMSLVQPFQPTAIIADSIFGTEQNYAYAEGKGIEAFMKYPSFHAEEQKSHQEDTFHKDHFPYDAPSDSYLCPNNQRLVYVSTETEKRISGYVAESKVYRCNSCKECPFSKECLTSSKGEYRTISINEKLVKYKQQAREKLNSEAGIRLRKKRSIEIESCFGDIKHNMGFRRFHVRGLAKVKTEITLIAMAHNIRKMHLKQMKKVA